MSNEPKPFCIIGIGGAGKTVLSAALRHFEGPTSAWSLIAHDDSGARATNIPELIVVASVAGGTGSGMLGLAKAFTTERRAWRLRRTIERFSQSPSSLLRVSPLDFEDVVAEIYRGLGYSVAKTQRSHDGGVDLVIEKTVDSLHQRYFVQCKHTSKVCGQVGVAAVRELFGVLSASLATAAILVTNGLFTREARKFLANCAFRLFGIDRNALASLAVRYAAVGSQH